mmetsp:Transcript_17781/g.44370  ORF Transcript_17781/g.44370 Transcript_17781/m.44370 type:complete len:218 (+) Transcript_17781:178-831(+)
MAAALPVTKLAGLLVKSLAKPLSKNIKNNLGKYDVAKRALVKIGQTNHTVTSYMTIWASGFRVKHIKPLEPEAALKTGAEFVGEGFVLTVSMAVVLFEYDRSSKKTALKNEQKRERIRETQQKLQAKLNTLDIRIKAVEDLLKQQQELEEKQNILTRVVPIPVEKPKYVEPPKEKLVAIDDGDDEDDTNKSNTVESSTASSNASESSQKKKSWWKFW